ncbi:ABC transporter permease [Olivibacter sp. SDN3]|uniref:ABC transporter permease n=1 Tax=Olivibacter sp. SDN3 TaxID=2764720 RepID=UPI0016516793|nr:FtsX-like permease family protein [Olivibacter sp. SDN3]QNL50949.1 ABC transporter permease [Olivibacter sp. SDN3]
MKQFYITLRHLWRNRLFTGLNILGLAIGISASWIIYQMVSFEFSYDQHQPDRDRIFQFYAHMKRGDGESREEIFIPKAILPHVLHDISGIEKTAPLYYRNYSSAKTSDGRTLDQLDEQVATLPDYFEMIGYQWLAGNPRQAIASDKVVLTAKRAQRYFPGKSPETMIGQTITYNDTVQKTVSGILVDLDYLNSFPPQEFFALNQEELTNTNWQHVSSEELLYVKLEKGVSTKTVLDQLNRINSAVNREIFQQYNFTSSFKLLPLADKHFATHLSLRARTASKPILFGLLGIAAFLLVLACINYINLTTAQLPQRAKEIGIRKTLGGKASALIWAYLKETLVLCILAVILSFLITAVALRVFAEYLPEGMNDFNNYMEMLLFTVLLISGITLIAGLYPSWLATRVQTVRVLKGQVSQSVGAYQLNLRKGLIIFQFVIAQVFVVCAIIIGQQLRYTLDKDLGFQHEAIVTVDIPYKVQTDSSYQGKQFVLKRMLEQHPEIDGVALGDIPMSNWMNGWMMDYRSDTGTVEKQLLFKNIDANYLKVYQIPLLAGRNILETDTIRELLINETALKNFGFSRPEDAIGQTLYQNDNPRIIVGVFKDFHQFSLRNEIPALGFTAVKPELESFNVKLASKRLSSWASTIALVEKEWKRVYPGVDFQYQFYDETIRDLYQQERRTAKLVTTATMITLLISCLGLYGLATLTAFQRTKEIGIRKVLGATISSVIALLSKDFVKLVLLALLIAAPIAWWAMNKWLENFAYKIEIQWWMFTLAGFGAVMIALLTVGFQAVKAAIANPVDSLRDE